MRFFGNDKPPRKGGPTHHGETTSTRWHVVPRVLTALWVWLLHCQKACGREGGGGSKKHTNGNQITNPQGNFSLEHTHLGHEGGVGPEESDDHGGVEGDKPGL